jgi:hypothetical protein
VCAQCSITRPFGDPEFLARPEVDALLGELSARIGAPNPLLICDDPDHWDWRAFLRERARALQPSP